MNLAHKRRARGRIEHTLLDGACRRHSNRIKTFARSPLRNLTIPRKVTNVSICHKGSGDYVILSRILQMDFRERYAMRSSQNSPSMSFGE